MHLGHIGGLEALPSRRYHQAKAQKIDSNRIGAASLRDFAQNKMLSFSRKKRQPKTESTPKRK
jgi:hypothetical protein